MTIGLLTGAFFWLSLSWVVYIR